MGVDGRGRSIQEAVRDLWNRVEPLREKGFHPITSVEIVDAKTGRVIETYEVTDPEFVAHIEAEVPKPAPRRTEEHRPPKPHEYPFIARLKLES